MFVTSETNNFKQAAASLITEQKFKRASEARNKAAVAAAAAAVPLPAVVVVEAKGAGKGEVAGALQHSTAPDVHDGTNMDEASGKSPSLSAKQKARIAPTLVASFSPPRPSSSSSTTTGEGEERGQGCVGDGGETAVGEQNTATIGKASSASASSSSSSAKASSSAVAVVVDAWQSSDSTVNGVDPHSFEGFACVACGAEAANR